MFLCITKIVLQDNWAVGVLVARQIPDLKVRSSILLPLIVFNWRSFYCNLMNETVDLHISSFYLTNEKITYHLCDGCDRSVWVPESADVKVFS